VSKPRGRLAEHRSLIIEFFRPGTREVSGRVLWRVGRVVIASTIVIANLIGVAVVLALALFVVPFPGLPDVAAVRFFNLLAAAAYVMVAVPLGIWIGIRGLFRLRRWLEEDRPPTPAERRIVLRAPLRLFFVQFALWFGAALFFGAMNAGDAPQAGVVVASVVALTGLVTAALTYLLVERLMRPAAARALVGQEPGRLAVPGVATRSVVAWAVGTGVPVAGIVAIGAANLTVGQATRQELSVVMVAIGGISLGVGLLAVILAARATAGPIDAVRRAMARIERGLFDSRVSVYDGTQVGQLQLGFNRMADGLAERERMRELFGTYVDPEVAKRILEEGTELEGEEVEVTIMFIDVRDFTAFAERSAAHEVVAMLNRLYERAVPVVYRHGGHVNKFVGDGLLAVFGAPTRLPDHADRALTAAVEIARVVRSWGTRSPSASV
jgi:adenylate cyclase